jgi:polysaccharide biosynthesis transport protein
MWTRKRFSLISLTLAIIAAAGGLLVWGLRPLRAAMEPDKRPKARLLIASSQPRVVFQTPENTSPDEELHYKRYLNTQMALSKSRFVFKAALGQDGISKLPAIRDMTDPIDWLQRNLIMERLGDSELVEVSLLPSNRLSSQDQATLINAVVRAYLDEVVNKEQRQRMARRDTLKKLSNTYADMIKSRRDTIRKLALKVGSDEGPSGSEKEVLPRLYQDLRTQ